MHRFGRSDQKWRDRWGGGFLVATILAMAAAWMVGSRLAANFNEEAAGQPSAAAGDTILGADSAGLGTDTFSGTLASHPMPFSVYFLQAGAFKNPEGAQRHADALREQGYPVRISSEGAFHKVFIGAYMSRDMAARTRDQVLAQHGEEFELFPVRVDVQGEPAVAASTAEAQGIYDQGVAALNGYLQAASAWWDSYAAGAPGPTGELAAYAGQVAQAAEQLRSQGADAATSQFILLADRVTANSAQLSNLALTPNVGGEQYRIAMDSYMALLDDYRAWAQDG